MRLCKLPTSRMSADFQPFPMAMPHDAQARHSVRPVRPPPSDGMDEPVILRGLLYFLILAAFFMIRYVLDVLLTPRVLDAGAHAAIDWVITAPRCSLNLLRSCSATLLPWATLRAWRCCDAAMIEKACLCGSPPAWTQVCLRQLTRRRTAQEGRSVAYDRTACHVHTRIQWPEPGTAPLALRTTWSSLRRGTMGGAHWGACRIVPNLCCAACAVAATLHPGDGRRRAAQSSARME